jgi:hypothetical protein
MPDFRIGSYADIEVLRPDVRFTPKSGHRLARSPCPLCAKSGHQPNYSITSLHESFFGQALKTKRVPV